MYPFKVFILTGVLALLLLTGARAQTPVYDYELSDTVATDGYLNTGFEAMTFSKNADSVFLLGRGSMTKFLGNQFSHSRPGFIIAKCDTLTLTCDTSRYWATDTVTYGRDFYVPTSLFYLGDNLIAVSANANDWEVHDTLERRRMSIDFNFINERTLRTDSLKRLKDSQTNLYYSFIPLHAESGDNTFVIIGGWVISDSTGNNTPASLLKLNMLTMQIEWFKEISNQVEVTTVRIINDKVIVTGTRFAYHPEHQTVAPFRTQFVTAYDLNTGNELWLKEYDRRFRHLTVSKSQILVSNNRIYLMSQGGKVPIYQVPYRPMLGLRAFPQLTCLDFDGNELWTKLYDTASYFDYIPQGMTFDKDSNIICAGLRISRSLEGFPEDNGHYGDGQMFITSWNKDNGKENWIKSYDRYWEYLHYTGGLLGLPTGGVIVSGYITDGWTRRGLIQRFNPYGCQAPYNVNCPGDPPLAVPQIQPAQTGSVSLYPNPVSHEAFVEFSPEFDLSQNLEIRMFNVTGQQVKTLKVHSSKTRISRDHLPSGLYLVQITNSREVIKTFKAVFR